MGKQLHERELAVLESLEHSDVALGSWNLVEKLERRGIAVSSATIGRVLNTLERMGYLQKEGFSGRVITPQGIQALREHRAASHFSRYQASLESASSAKTPDEFLQILQARRAIEREIAGLAAVKITDAELEKLEELIGRQLEAFRQGESIAQIDIAFHQTIARASRNAVLESLYQMLFPYGQQSAAFEAIRPGGVQDGATAHRAILDALKAHDPPLAEKAMVEHIQGLIQDVTNYRSI